MKNAFKKKSVRLQLAGKRVRIKSHVGPAFRGRVGYIEDITHCANQAVVIVDAIPVQIIKGDGMLLGDRIVNFGSPAYVVTMSTKGLVLL